MVIKPSRFLFEGKSPGESSKKSIESNDLGTQQWQKPLVSLVVPAYNEAAIIEKNLTVLCQYMELLRNEYDWEIIIVNDGSTDETSELVEDFARARDNIYVVHHVINLGLGRALRSGFDYCRGDYIVTLDLDLSYSPDHIRKLLTKIRATRAKIVVASPYMKGGKSSNVPWVRLTLSRWANRFLSFTAKGHLSTLTGMVRVYDAKFLETLNIRSQGMEINPELIHKTMILGAQVEEIPAHLNWHPQKAKKAKRKSSMKILRHTWETIFSGFIFRPVIFFIIPSIALFMISLYANIWVLIHILTSYQHLGEHTRFPDPTEAVANAFNQAPHTFIIGGMTLMLAIQLLSLGILSSQSKSYFEEVFHLGTAIYRSTQDNQRNRRGTENE